jgi:uncharacterized protein
MKPRGVVEALLVDVPTGRRVTDVYVGANWVLSLVIAPNGEQRAGVASAPQRMATSSRFQVGHATVNDDAQTLAGMLLSGDEAEAAVGLATLNALIQVNEAELSRVDAADWLAAQCAGRRAAIFGRFPFIDTEIRPQARQVWVFEHEPQTGELSLDETAAILPQADIVALTSSSIINHTIDSILPHRRAGSVVALLGPSTPLTRKLLDCGIDALFGVRVDNLPLVIASVLAGSGFQKMDGLQRVSLFKVPR